MGISFFHLFESLPPFLEPVLTVDRHFLGLLAVAGKDVVDDVDEETGGAAGRVVHGVAQVRIGHLDHEGADLSRGAELAVESRLSEMGEQVFEDVALDVGPELAKVDGVEHVDHLLEHVRIDDLEHGVAKVLCHLRIVLDQRRHVREDLVADEVAQILSALEAPLGPAEALGLGGEEEGAVPGAEPALELAGGFLLVEEFQVDEVGDLLDVGDGIGHATGPQDVGDLVELAPQCLVHPVPFSSQS